MLLTMKENRRLQIFQEVLSGERTVKEASDKVGISERQGWRVVAAVREAGALGVIHGNRGKPCPFRLSDEVRDQIVALRQGSYAGFNDRHFTDELRDEENIRVGRERVRALLRASGIAPVRPVKKRKHRCRRDPRDRFGELLQGDASDHDWLEGRGPRLTLAHFVDDATGFHWATFCYRETTEAYFRVMLQILKTHGLPRGIYVDCHGVFKVNQTETRLEQETGKEPFTHFRRAMEEMAIHVMYATSPQAKGRIERWGGIDQDRLVSELRKAKACTLEDANRVLKRYLIKSNRRFARTPKNPTSAFTPLPEGCDLKQILCWKEERTVANDNTIAYHGQRLQIPRSPCSRSFAKKKVVVHLCLDGSIHVFHRRERIAYLKHGRVDPGMVSIVSVSPLVVAAHCPTLTFSRGH
jgi:transposase